MIRDRAFIKGKITATVFGPDGKVKKWSPQLDLSELKKKLKKARPFQGFLLIIQALFYIVRDSISPRPMISVNHNIVTDQGDAGIADLMSNTPARNKFNNANAYIEVGTAYSGTAMKAQNGCHTPSGSRKGMEATYPKQKGSFGAANDNVTQYRVIFTAGLLTATINEAAIMNASTSGDSLTYGHITPDAVVAVTDTLQIDWELTFLGA